MDPSRLKALLEEVRDGALAPEAAMESLSALPFEDLGFARVDHHRALRTGFPEVVYGEGKTGDQVASIVASLEQAGSNAMVTRLDADKGAVVRKRFPQANYYADARVLTLVGTPPEIVGRGTVFVVSAGTSDQPVAEEAALTLEMMGSPMERLYDVGVAGIHRILGDRDRLEAASVIVVVAGMEGALPSVVAGLVSKPVVAVPTSVGYGAAFGGVAALLGMLNTCATGVAVVNIDNGFGGGFLAGLINRD